MKQEDLNSKAFEFLDELKDAISSYIDYYNNYRPHKTLNYKTPQDYEKEYHKTKKEKLFHFPSFINNIGIRLKIGSNSVCISFTEIIPILVKIE